VRAEHAPLECLEIDRALAPERGGARAAPRAAALALPSQRGRSQGRGAPRAKRRGTKRRGTRAALTLRPSGDYLARTSVFWMESSRERRHYIRSYGFSPPASLAPAGITSEFNGCQPREGWPIKRPCVRLFRALLRNVYTRIRNRAFTHSIRAKILCN